MTPCKPISGAIARATFLVAACAIAADPSFAQPSTTMPTVVVTSSRIAQPLSDALPSSTVIDRDQIERWQNADLVGVLSRQAGVEFARAGGAGGAASLFVRGTNSSQVLVLVDGVRLNAGVSGAASLGGIALDAIERIEIVRGNLSSLYGSEAIGGVVQIFTRNAGTGRLSLSAEAGQGSSRTAAASIAQGFGSHQLGGSAGLRRSEQFSAIDAARVIPSPFSAGANPDLDAHRNANASLGWRWRAHHNTQLAVSGWISDNRTEFDNTFDGPTAEQLERSRLWTISADLNHAFSEASRSRLQFGTMRDRSRNRSTAPFSFDNADFASENRQLSWSHALRLTDGALAQVGVEWLRQEGASTAFDPAFGNVLTAFSREVRSGWLGMQGHAGAHQLQANIRHDRYTDAGDATSGLLAYGYRIWPALKLIAQVSNSFRAPSFSDLYFPFFGNPQLQPEKSRSAELGLQHTVADRTLRATVFRTETRSLIAFDPSTMRAENIDRARISGAEIEAVQRAGRWHFGANASATRPINVSTGQRLLRRAPYTIALNVAYDTGDWRAGVELLRSGRRIDLDINTFERITLDPYTLARVAAAMRVLRNGWLTLRVENVFDERYQTVSGYNTQPRTVYAGIQWRQ